MPGDIAVAGFDDTPLATMMWPELTTIHRPIADMARQAVRLVIEQVRAKRNGGIPQMTLEMLDFTLVQRDSSAGVKAPAKT